MKTSRGEDSIVNLPTFAAKLYDSMMQSDATKMQDKEIDSAYPSKRDWVWCNITLGLLSG